MGIVGQTDRTRCLLSMSCYKSWTLVLYTMDIESKRQPSGAGYQP